MSLFVLPVTVKSLKACSAVLLMASLTLFTVVPPTVIGALVTVISPTFKPLLSNLVVPAVTVLMFKSLDNFTLSFLLVASVSSISVEMF